MTRRAALVMAMALIATMLPVLGPGTPAAWASINHVPVAWASQGPGFATSDAISEPFTMVGLSWQGEAPDRVWFRTRNPGQGWSGWQELPLEDEHGPDIGSSESAFDRGGSEPIWTGPKSEVQFQVTGGNIDEVAASLVDTTSRTKPFIRRLADIFAPPKAGAVSQPAINPRESWDPDGSCQLTEPPELVQVTNAFVHHTTMTNDYAAADVPGYILGICLYHTQSRGWNDIAYNFLVDRFGGVWEGRTGGMDQGVVGAHTQGFNSYSTGIALIGNFVNASPSSSAIQSLTELLTWKLSVHNIDPRSTEYLVSKGSAKWPEGVAVTLETVSGHRDAQATTCPGVGLYAVLESVEASIALDWRKVPLKTYSSPLVGDFDGDGTAEGAVFRTTDGTWQVTEPTGQTDQWADFSTASGWSAQVVGDFGGDGRDDIANFHPANGTWWVSRSTGSGFATALWADFSAASGWSAQVAGDFDGDGRDDIANFHPANGTWWVSRSTGSSFNTELWADFSTPNGWSSQVVGDFDGDGRDDIANFHPSNGTWWVSRSTGTSFETSLWADYSTASGWRLQLVGDFDGDDRDDIVNHHSASNTWWVSRSQGRSFTTGLWATIGASDHWSFSLVQDTNGDGNDDVVVIDAYDGVLYRALGQRGLLAFEALEDTPWRTTLGGSASASLSGNATMLFFGQEFTWLSVSDLDASSSQTVASAQLPRP